MAVYHFDPLRDARWPEFLERHPRAAVFHTPGWLDALRRTYGYEPVGVTSSPPGESLRNGLVFCRVRSWLTGRRLVSLPFSDHCEPLVESEDELRCLLSSLNGSLDRDRCRYAEIRPLILTAGDSVGLERAETFCFHSLDLSPSLQELFRGFHKDCIQRKIRRAEREALVYEEGRSEALLARFYRLLVLTRRRHQLPPQPFAWFRTLTACMGDIVKVRLVSKGDQPIASILTLRYKRASTYKWGCSDRRFSNLGGMQLLIWKAIQEAKCEGFLQFDMGRSDWDDDGLIKFKSRWGAALSSLTYWRSHASSVSKARDSWRMHVAKHVFAQLPDAVLIVAGKLLYRHVG